MNNRPSDDSALCGRCHEAVAKSYRTSLHYTTAGLKHGLSPRFAPSEAKLFEQKVFPGACNGCHASCGDCHLRSPSIGGVSAGLLQRHRFVRRDEGKTCALCHGGRVYPEFTGEYGGTPDVHYQKGMACLDCHSKSESHGDGTVQVSRQERKERPSCAKCHPVGQEKSEKAKLAHGQHGAKLSCTACHSAAPYRNCFNCHLGKGAEAKPLFLLGRSPRHPETVTTVRLIPTVRDTFASAGLGMETFDALPNYWDTAPHNIKKRTDRTRSCDACHEEKELFLRKEVLIPNGSKANEALIFVPKSLK